MDKETDFQGKDEQPKDLATIETEESRIYEGKPGLDIRYELDEHVWVNVYVEDKIVKCRTCDEQGFVTLRNDLKINPTKYPCPVCFGKVDILEAILMPKKARVVTIIVPADCKIIYEVEGVYEQFTGRFTESFVYSTREDAEAVLALSKETTKTYSAAELQSGRRPLPKNMESPKHNKSKLIMPGNMVMPVEEVVEDPKLKGIVQ